MLKLFILFVRHKQTILSHSWKGVLFVPLKNKVYVGVSFSGFNHFLVLTLLLLQSYLRFGVRPYNFSFIVAGPGKFCRSFIYHWIQITSSLCNQFIIIFDSYIIQSAIYISITINADNLLLRGQKNINLLNFKKICLFLQIKFHS